MMIYSFALLLLLVISLIISNYIIHKANLNGMSVEKKNATAWSLLTFPVTWILIRLDNAYKVFNIDVFFIKVLVIVLVMLTINIILFKLIKSFKLFK